MDVWPDQSSSTAGWGSALRAAPQLLLQALLLESMQFVI